MSDLELFKYDVGWGWRYNPAKHVLYASNI